MESEFIITFRKIGEYNIVISMELPLHVNEVIGYTVSESYAKFDDRCKWLELKCPCLKLPIYIVQGEHFTDVQVEFIKHNLQLAAHNFSIYIKNGLSL